MNTKMVHTTDSYWCYQNKNNSGFESHSDCN